MAGTMIYRTGISPAWIDYNGHLNDAYYVVVLSLATDAAMERVGIDAAYRASTQGTLYSVEMHMHWRQEVKAEDTLEVDVYVLGVDAKRLHLGYDVRVVGKTEVAATAEFMLLHVRQGDQPGAAPFPPDIAAKIAELAALADGAAWPGPRSRALSLVKR
jgi:acyl-CoA thioester hydrolase